MAATEQPEYTGKTFGVISLVGEDQALLIEKLLRTYLSPVEYEQRRVVCGNAAHFQGDEREVVFLSMVDAHQGGPLSLRTEDRYKKRFNVAASRAQDQMWVVYSLDPQTDLKAGDLRLRLIEHAEDPTALMRLLQQGERQVESEFERQVFRRLTSTGYRVTPQWKVGHYRIDMVVEGAGRRLAVECDGDRYHPIERLEEDMGRQAILERLGWTFVRIRGIEFFRDPERTMHPVFERLEALEIPPEGSSSEVRGTGPTGTDDELKDRVIRRAAELCRLWRGEEDPLPVEPMASDSDAEVGRKNGHGEVALEEVSPVAVSASDLKASESTANTDTDNSATSPPPSNPAALPTVSANEEPWAPHVPVQLPLEVGHRERVAEGLDRSSKVEDILALLTEKGLKAIDKRASGGALWVLGGIELTELIAGFKDKGFKFTFSPNGGRATLATAGWWAK
jgi:very-short-patch-repair endonuclease